MTDNYSLRDDYSEGAHPRILEALQFHNIGQTEGYGNDHYCKEARRLIQKHTGLPDATIHFVAGGTQANMLVLSSLLQPYESVIGASSAHIAVHETGAVEATGHKINLIPSMDGKLNPGMIDHVVHQHHGEHSVKPRVVFISQSTELGTLYSKKELTALHEYCQQNELLLYLDGARLAVALTADNNDLTLPELAARVDVMYIGGTKNGALLGEAIVFPNPELQPYFRHMMKQKGALLAKGRIFGIQFLELFTDNLFFELGRQANSRARQLSNGISDAGFTFKTPPESNQLFPVFPNELIKKLKENFDFHIWEKKGNTQSTVRLVTSWGTKGDVVQEFLRKL